jgi:hypothetical protein
MNNNNVGYEVHVEVPENGVYIFSVQSNGKIRDSCSEAYRSTRSNSDFWEDRHYVTGDSNCLGMMIGEFTKEGEQISAVNFNDAPLVFNKSELTDLIVRKVEEVSIEDMLRDHSVADSSYAWIGT